MIDIHSHVIPFVDDGSKSMETSLEMLKTVQAQGVTTLFCTPHFRYGVFESNKEKVLEKFNLLKEEAKKEDISVNLLLGQEISYKKDIVKEIKNGFYYTLNDSKYVLIEFPFDKKVDIPEVVYNLVRAGYEPIVAHFERYFYSNIDIAYELRALGGHIQVTANEICGDGYFAFRKLTAELMKNDLVDFVAGDYHSSRTYRMEKAAKFVRKKFGAKTYQKLFVTNAEKFSK